MKHLDKNEIRFSNLSGADEIGKIFFWEDRLFRAIHHGSVEKVKELFSNGLIDELVDKKLFPKSWITDYEIDGYGLVVEHERIHPVTYPREWSFSMLKDAALTELKINFISRKYNYQTKDANANNIVFDATIPMFVDLGSFTKVNSDFIGWLGYENFLRSYFYPLQIWKDGNAYIARRSQIGSELENMPHESYLLYRNPLVRTINGNLARRIIDFYFKYRKLSLIESAKIKNKIPGFPGEVLSFLKDKRLLPLQSVDFSSWINRIQNISMKPHVTGWQNYHDEINQIYEKGDTYPRFDRIVELINEYNISTIVELAGNAGTLSRIILEETNVKNVICTDYDENAVDLMYLSFKNSRLKLTPAILNFIASISVSCEIPIHERFAADGAIALAVTHHLILTQKIPIDDILKIISMYTKKYVFIEFMPMGLYDGKHLPPLPSWYTVEWFRISFKKQFRLILEEQLEENRILFLGALRRQSGND